MGVLVVSFIVIVLLAIGVMVYAAYPDRGREVPGAPWLGGMVAKPVRWYQRLIDRESRTLHH